MLRWWLLTMGVLVSNVEVAADVVVAGVVAPVQVEKA